MALLTDKEAVDVNYIDANGSFTPLVLLCFYNQSEGISCCVEILLPRRPDVDVDVNLTDKHGMNTLMRLCRHSIIEKIVEVTQLISH